MSVSGSLQHIFENPSLPENPSLLESLSGIRIKPPVKSIHSFTEIFGELHFKENHHHHHNNNNEYVSNTTPTTTTQHKNINHGSIKPSRDLLKNEKEESYVNTTE